MKAKFKIGMLVHLTSGIFSEIRRVGTDGKTTFYQGVDLVDEDAQPIEFFDSDVERAFTEVGSKPARRSGKKSTAKKKTSATPRASKPKTSAKSPKTSKKAEPLFPNQYSGSEETSADLPM